MFRNIDVMFRNIEEIGVAHAESGAFGVSEKAFLRVSVPGAPNTRGFRVVG